MSFFYLFLKAEAISSIIYPSVIRNNRHSTVSYRSITTLHGYFDKAHGKTTHMRFDGYLFNTPMTYYSYDIS